MSHERRILPPTSEGTASYCTACEWHHFTDSYLHTHAIDVLENHAQAWNSHMNDLAWDFPRSDDEEVTP